LAHGARWSRPSSVRASECASRWYFDEGQDIVRVSRWLGHASVEMTQRYLALPADAAQGVDMARQLGHAKQKMQA
jgi:integrase